jgi:hypothetical protein
METPLEFRSDLPDDREINGRRKNTRFACDGQLYLVPIGENHQNFWSAALRDLSTKGVGLTLRRRFELGTMLSIDWCPSDLPKLPSLVVRVVRVFHMPDNTWQHGCELIGDIDSEELAAFLAAFQAAVQSAAHLPAKENALSAKPPVQGKQSRESAAWTVIAQLRRTISDADRDLKARRRK